MVLFGLRLSTDDEFKPGVELQKGKCTICHVGANFTDEQYHNLGVGWDEKTKKFAGRGPLGPGAHRFQDRRRPRLVQDPDGARHRADGPLHARRQPEDPRSKWSSITTRGASPIPSLDPDMKPLKLTSQESADLVAFMKALTGEHKGLEELLPTLPRGPGRERPRPAGGPDSARQDGIHGVPFAARPLAAGLEASIQDRVAARLSLAATRSGRMPANGFWPELLTHFHAASLAERAFAFERHLMEFPSPLKETPSRSRLATQNKTWNGIC